MRDEGMGFWFRMRGWGLSWSVVGRDYRPIFSERYSGRHGIRRRYVAYLPVGFGRRWRFEFLTPRKSTTTPVQ